MNELSQRLYELRKNRNLSQEELADKLGVSRQAVSKWECGESTPDTDNLIKLSHIYGVSLDALVYGKAQDDRLTENDPPHAQVQDLEVDSTEEDEEEDDEKIGEAKVALAKKNSLLARLLLGGIYPCFAVIAFLIWGFYGNAWYISWTVLLTIPVWHSAIECVIRKRVSHFCYPVLVTFVYLVIGMQRGLWHPWWILFVTIPVFYAVAELVDALIRRNESKK